MSFSKDEDTENGASRQHQAMDGESDDEPRSKDRGEPDSTVVDFEKRHPKGRLSSASVRDNRVNIMSDTPTRPEIDAKLQAAEARGDTKLAEALGEVRTAFARLEGKFDNVNTRITDLQHSTGGTKGTILATGVAVVALIVGILTYGQGWFGIGVTTRDTIKSVVTEVIQQQHQQPTQTQASTPDNNGVHSPIVEPSTTLQAPPPSAPTPPDTPAKR